MRTTRAIRLAVVIGWGAPTWWALPALAAGVAVTELAVVHVTVARARWAFSLTEGAIAAALVVAPGGWTVPAVLVGVAVSQRLRRHERLKLEYNSAQVAASAALAAGTAVTLGGGVPAAAAGMIGYWLVNQTLSALPVAVLSGQRVLRLVTEDLLLHAVHAAGSVSIGLLGAWLALTEPVGLLGLLVPTVLLWTSYDEQTRRAAEARLFAELARGQEQAANPSTDVLATVVLTAAARLFGGADVEMVLLEHDGPVTYVGNEHGVQRRRSDPAALDASWVLRTLGSAGVVIGTERGRPFCSARVGDPDHPLAVLVAHRPVGAPPFGRHEASLAAVLVQQASSWLTAIDFAASREAAAALGSLADLDAHAAVAPTLGMLRDSASRLARLATDGGTGAIADIVDELHAVERAVASLLGVLALAAEPELAALDAGPPPTTAAPVSPLSAHRAGGEGWTTTGLLEEVAARS